MKKLILITIIGLLLASCSENYSNGERIGIITKFSKTGLLWKSYEGELHVTQTGMNSTTNEFQFSIDNDHEDSTVIRTLDSAANKAWKVKLIYHQTFGKNWFYNRGDENFFVTQVIVLDKNMQSLFNNKKDSTSSNQGKVIDTIYVVIDKSQLRKK